MLECLSQSSSADCFSLSQRCDGTQDCLDGSDESGCDCEYQLSSINVKNRVFSLLQYCAMAVVLDLFGLDPPQGGYIPPLENHCAIAMHWKFQFWNCTNENVTNINRYLSPTETNRWRIEISLVSGLISRWVSWSSTENTSGTSTSFTTIKSVN